MSSATIRRSITGSDPRSPLQLSSLVTSFPQHQLITSFQTFQPVRYSPTRTFSRRAVQSPVLSRGGGNFHDGQTNTGSSKLVKRGRSSSFAKLLGPRNVPGMCSCGQGRKSVKHLVRDCPRFEAERERLVSQSPVSPTTTAPMMQSTVQQAPAESATQQKLVQKVRRHTKTLFGKYNMVDAQKNAEERRTRDVAPPF
jgi:hypothetical protein